MTSPQDESFYGTGLKNWGSFIKMTSPQDESFHGTGLKKIGVLYWRSRTFVALFTRRSAF